MIIDGRALAKEILARAKTRAALLPRPPVVLAYAPLKTPATASYLKIKMKSAGEAGCLFKETDQLVSFAAADAVIIQLPLPSILSHEILNAIPVAQDADVLSRAARTLFERNEESALLPPVVAAMKEILDQAQTSVQGKRAVVIGNGFLVGVPVATWLKHKGAQVTVADSRTKDLPEILHASDIVVSGAGVPHLITPDMLKEGVILIDAGTSESGGAIVGDADPACAAKCVLFTPVPGGIGPVAVACLFENALALASRRISLPSA